MRRLLSLPIGVGIGALEFDRFDLDCRDVLHYSQEKFTDN